ncbi:MAG: LCP family protein [Chloroflexota bacterium]
MRTISIIVLSIVAIGVLGFFSWLSYTSYNTSTVPTVENTAESLFATRTPIPFVKTSTPSISTKVPSTLTPNSPTATIEVQLTPTQTAEAGGCGVTGQWNILVLGSDYAELRGKKGSDLTRIMNINFDSKKISIFAFPRDLWVDTTDIGLIYPTITSTTLGRVFYEGRLRSLQFSESGTIIDGTKIAAKMIQKNFLVTTDHFISIDLSNLASIIDSLGGLPINIPAATTDPYIGMIIPAGLQTLNGIQVVAYVRAIPDSDFGRIQRNNLVISAIREKLINLNIIQDLPVLFTKYKNVIATDLSLEQLNHLGCIFIAAKDAPILEDNIKQEWTTAGPQGSLLWNKEIVQNRLRELGFIK